MSLRFVTIINENLYLKTMCLCVALDMKRKNRPQDGLTNSFDRKSTLYYPKYWDGFSMY